MAGSARYTANLDANVLDLQLVRDLLLSPGACGLYHARWGADSNAEWTRNFIAKMPGIADKVPAIVAAMSASIPDSLVAGYERLVSGLELPDADDRQGLLPARGAAMPLGPDIDPHGAA